MAPSSEAGSGFRVEVSAGELIDKITILAIKARKIGDPVKLRNIRAELSALLQVWDRSAQSSPRLEALTRELQAINETLWGIEDGIRACERDQRFDDRFIHLARSVYRTNDRRSALKRQVNELLQSRLVEEKSYEDYEAA